MEAQRQSLGGKRLFSNNHTLLFSEFHLCRSLQIKIRTVCVGCRKPDSPLLCLKIFTILALRGWNNSNPFFFFYPHLWVDSLTPHVLLLSARHQIFSKSKKKKQSPVSPLVVSDFWMLRVHFFYILSLFFPLNWSDLLTTLPFYAVSRTSWVSAARHPHCVSIYLF